MRARDDADELGGLFSNSNAQARSPCAPLLDSERAEVDGIGALAGRCRPASMMRPPRPSIARTLQWEPSERRPRFATIIGSGHGKNGRDFTPPRAYDGHSCSPPPDAIINAAYLLFTRAAHFGASGPSGVSPRDTTAAFIIGFDVYIATIFADTPARCHG